LIHEKANELFGKDWDELKKVTKKLQSNAPHIYGDGLF
jgi:hypothetical protein